jgi:ApaG protein
VADTSSSSCAVTQGIRVEVRSRYLPERSQPDQKQYLFAYAVRITNESNRTVQLVSRHWIITDAEGRVEEVRGLAVVGHQPVLKRGEHFEYTSWTRLDTAHGTMRGTFFCMTEDAHAFEAEVPEFALVYPGALH